MELDRASLAAGSISKKPPNSAPYQPSNNPMPSNTVIKIADLEATLARVLPKMKPGTHPPIINGIVMEAQMVGDVKPLDLAGKILSGMPAMEKTRTKPTAIQLPDKRWILGFIGDEAPRL